MYIGLINRIYPPEVDHAHILAREKADRILIDSFRSPDEVKNGNECYIWM